MNVLGHDRDEHGRGEAPRDTHLATGTDVVIVGAGPTGLMLAGELLLAGVRPLVLERQPQPQDVPKAGGLAGRIVDLMHYRGLREGIEAANSGAQPAHVFPFGGIHLDYSALEPSPFPFLRIPQSRLEQVLEDRARELGAEIRRGHRVVSVGQDHAAVTAEVHGPDGPYRVSARYLVGCDGARGTVRGLAGIAMPGITYPEVNRLGHVLVPDSVVLLANGDLDVPGLGRIGAGFTRTKTGVFGFGPMSGGGLLVHTSEEETADDDEPMTLDELRDSIRRVLGGDLPIQQPRRLSRFTFHARQAERYRAGRILLAGDAAHLLPATGSSLNLGMLDAVNLAWKLAAAVRGQAPEGLLDTYHEERHLAGARALLQTQAQVALRRGHDAAADALREVLQELLADSQPLRRLAALIGGTDIRYPSAGAEHHPLAGAFAPDLALHTDQGATSVAELMHAAQPVLLVLADRPDLRRAAREWQHRIAIRAATTDDRPADALLIRPDAHIAWAAAIGEPSDTAVPALQQALSHWFGAPAQPAAPDTDRAGDAALAWNQPGLAGPGTLSLSSPDFDHEGTIPLAHASAHIGGQDISPELKWTAAPAGTAQLLLIVEDPDAPMPYPFPHCLALLDPELTGLPRGALAAESSAPGVRLPATRFARGWFGPAPIAGHGPHRYAFQLFALAEPVLEPVGPVDPRDLVSAARTVLARGRYDGFYQR